MNDFPEDQGHWGYLAHPTEPYTVSLAWDDVDDETTRIVVDERPLNADQLREFALELLQAATKMDILRNNLEQASKIWKALGEALGEEEYPDDANPFLQQ